jgi:hypothetical protein
MSVRRALIPVLATLVAAGAAAPPAAASAGKPRGASAAVTVTLDRERVATALGDGFGFTSTITNTTGRPLAGLVAHLNIVSLGGGAYVDPEDWSPRRTQYLAPLGPGASVDLSWGVTAVNGGRLGVYVTVVPSRAPQTAPAGLAVGPPIDLRVAERRTLNSGGVLFVALGVPGLLAVATAGVHARRRRT